MKIFKKIWLLPMLALMSMSISGCSNSKGAEDFDEKELTKISKEYAQQMAIGDFDTVASNFSDAVKNQLDSKALESGWKDVVKSIGEYKAVNDSTFVVKNNNALVEVILEYELNGLKVSFAFDSDNKVAGLNINYSPIKEKLTTNEDFEESKIAIGDGENKLDGILTLPKNTENPSVVVMVQGSGQSDMDETIGALANKPFKDIAHGLAQNGIASIRYNKRYYQYQNTATPTITIEDEVLNDVYFAVDMAAKNENLNSEKIYIVGHSLGGMLAPKIAKENANVAGIISLAGSPRKLEDIILDQNKDAIDAMSDKSDEEKKLMLDQVKEEVNKVKNLKPEDKSTTIFGINSEYWNSLNTINTPEIVKELNIPMLFLQGDADFQVYADVDFKEWKDILLGRDNATFKSYPGLNHLFMKNNGKSDITEYDIKGNVDDTVISDMADWINK